MARPSGQPPLPSPPSRPPLTSTSPPAASGGRRVPDLSCLHARGKHPQRMFAAALGREAFHTLLNDASAPLPTRCRIRQASQEGALAFQFAVPSTPDRTLSDRATLQKLGPWIPAGTALALGFWSPAAGVYAGLMFIGSGAVMLCFSIFCINGNPARGEGGLDKYFSFALPKFRGLNFTFQAGLAGVKWALPRWDPLLGLSACFAGFLLCAAGVELAQSGYKRMFAGRR